MKITIHDRSIYIQTEKPEEMEKGDAWIQDEADDYMEFAQMFDRIEEIVQELQEDVEVEVPEDDEPER